VLGARLCRRDARSTQKALVEALVAETAEETQAVQHTVAGGVEAVIEHIRIDTAGVDQEVDNIAVVV